MLKRLLLGCCLLAGLWGLPFASSAQNAGAHISDLNARLDSLSRFIPGINEKVQLAISGVPLKDYLRALGRAADINFHVDPALTMPVNNTLNNVTAGNILLLLAQQYNLDIQSTGNILVVRPWQNPLMPYRPKDPRISYRQLDNTISMELNGDSLSAVAKKITTLSGKNVLVPPALQGKTVSAFISAAAFDVAMDKLAFANEIKMVRTNDNFYLFQPLEDGEQLFVNNERSTAVKKSFRPLTSGASASVGLSSRTAAGTKLISVAAANASLADLVRGAAQEMGKSYFIYTDIKGAISSINANDLTFDNFLNLIFKGTDYTFMTDGGVYMIGERRSEGLRANKAVMLQNRSIDTVLAMIPLEWKRGVEIKEFREQNTILLSGSKPQIEEIASFIRQIDVLVPQVLIEVTLIDVHKSRKVATGLSAGVADSVKTGGSLLSGMDFTFSSGSVNDLLNRVGSVFSVNLGHVVPSFYLNIKALEAQNNIEVRSVPKLAALNGHSATLSIGNTVWYKNVTQALYPSATTNTSIYNNTYQSSEANLAISIRPVVSGDEQVTLGIKIDISDFTALPTDGSPPPKSTSKFESLLRVHNEDMVVLGGIERTENSENGSGIPLLSRIPILKYIFSSRSKTRSKVVTLVFIKPTIIR
jgi:type IV pilus assembly protein PilQ